MAYTIVKSDGTVLTSIADGTINTTSTSVGLPGRNYAGYGQTLDTNFVHQIESYAASTPPSNPLRGQFNWLVLPARDVTRQINQQIAEAHLFFRFFLGLGTC